MPLQQILPTWLALNNANFTSQSGMQDPVSGQPYNAGGLNLGDYFDVTNDEAASASYQSNGILYEGRYRLVQVDSGATAANVKTGTVGYVRAGSTVKSAVITNAGSGGTAGSYTVNATAGSGGGSGAQISVTVGSSGTVTSVSVINPGYGYVSAPSFNVATPTGASGATVAAQLGISVNVVTSGDVAYSGLSNSALAGIGLVRPVVFLNSITPGNYGFVQELGTATVLGSSNLSDKTIADYVDYDTSANNGTVTTRTSPTNSPIGKTIGNAIDTPQTSLLFKAILNNVPVVQE